MKTYGYLLVYGEKLNVSMKIIDTGDKVLTPLKSKETDVFLDFESCMLECPIYANGEFENLKLGKSVTLEAPHFCLIDDLPLLRLRKKNEHEEMLKFKIAEKLKFDVDNLSFTQLCKLKKEAKIFTKRKYPDFKYFSDEYLIDIKNSLVIKLSDMIEKSISKLKF